MYWSERSHDHQFFPPTHARMLQLGPPPRSSLGLILLLACLTRADLLVGSDDFGRGLLTDGNASLSLADLVGVSAGLAANAALLSSQGYDMAALAGTISSLTARNAQLRADLAEVTSYVCPLVANSPSFNPAIRLSPFMSVTGNEVSAWEFITFRSQSYLALADKTNRLGGYNDSLVSIYRFDATTSSCSFQPFSSVFGQGAVALKFFVINGTNTLFLAVANREMDSVMPREASRFNINSQVWRLNVAEDGFALVQNIPTSGASDVKFYEDATNGALLVFANFYNGRTYQLNSTVLRFNGTLFVPVGSIPTRGASDIEITSINGVTYLAVANTYNEQGDTYSALPLIYRYGSAFPLTVVQNLSVVVGASDMEFFTIANVNYLAVASVLTNTLSASTTSMIFRFTGTVFVPFQSIPTRGALRWTFFRLVSSGSANSIPPNATLNSYLAVANSRTPQPLPTNPFADSEVYQFNGTAFSLVASIPTVYAAEMEFFAVNGQNFLAVANAWYNATARVQSIVYSIDRMCL
jgi:hypothetical protein